MPEGSFYDPKVVKNRRKRALEAWQTTFTLWNLGIHYFHIPSLR